MKNDFKFPKIFTVGFTVGIIINILFTLLFLTGLAFVVVWLGRLIF